MTIAPTDLEAPAIVPVLDLKAGQAVHACGADRAHYRPVRSVLHPGSDPLGLARAYRDRLGLRSLYLADLDAIAGGPASVPLYRELVALGIDLWVDAGLRNGKDLSRLSECGIATYVAGSETFAGPTELEDAIGRAGPQRLVFSLDLKAGRPLLANGSQWRESEPSAIAAEAIERGVRRLLLLDLARVGSGHGLGTLPLVRELSASRSVEIAVGGGIRSRGDIEEAALAGASAVLLGSVLHTGAIEIAAGHARVSS